MLSDNALLARLADINNSRNFALEAMIARDSYKLMHINILTEISASLSVDMLDLTEVVEK